MKNLKIYSYVVRYDSGFAPNPFGDYCSLATCKPRIRKSIHKDDWVVGTGSVVKLTLISQKINLINIRIL